MPSRYRAALSWAAVISAHFCDFVFAHLVMFFFPILFLFILYVYMCMLYLSLMSSLCRIIYMAMPRRSTTVVPTALHFQMGFFNTITSRIHLSHSVPCRVPWLPCPNAR